MGEFANALSGQSQRAKKPTKLYMMAGFVVLIASSFVLWTVLPGTRVIGEVIFAGTCVGGLGVYCYGRFQRKSDASVIRKYGLK